jgi:hypothetical protein
MAIPSLQEAFLSMERLSVLSAMPDIGEYSDEIAEPERVYFTQNMQE